jgi:hypothetical protein
MKVRVFSPDQQEFIGIGEMHREDLTVVDDNDESKVICILPDHPHIVMDDGTTLCGIECWWESL